MSLEQFKQKEKVDIIINVRVTQTDKQWLDKNNIQPGLLFRDTIQKLRQQHKK